MAATEPSYQRLPVDQRRAQLLAAGSRLFAEHSYEEISMQQIAREAGVSKPLLYHYFPSKTELFKAAVADKAIELLQVISPASQGDAIEQLSAILDAYLGWIDANSQTWSKLMQSAASLPEAGEMIDGFRQQATTLILSQLVGNRKAPPALRTAIRGWLGYMDAAILDWIDKHDLTATQLREILVAVFIASLTAAQQIDPKIKLIAAQ